MSRAANGAASRAALLCAALSLGACTQDPCAGKSGLCIAAHVDGNAQHLTQLLVTLDGGQTMTTQPSTGGISLPVQFAVLVGTAPASSPFTLRLDGLRGGDTVASDQRDVAFDAKGRASVSFRLDEASPGGGDGGGGGDMAVMGAPTLAGADPITVDELQPIDVTMTATDPLGTSVTLSAANLPGNAKFDAATGRFTWTPGYTDAGMYTVKVTATPADPARAGTYDFVITVKNAADPIVIGGAPALGAVPIGDWDKDGFGDLAVCTGDAAGATGKYHIKILYGAATGLPLDAASQAARTDSFDIAATNLGGSQYSCQGGDYDGDGHADIIFADPNNDYWHVVDAQNASPKQGQFTVLFGGARGAVPQAITIVGNENFGTQLGLAFSVGDFTGDGKADIGTTWGTNATTYALFAGTATRASVTTSANEIDYTGSGFVCHDPVSVAFTDFDKDGKADWVVEDPGLNAPATPPSTCDATAMAMGGLRVIKGTNAAPLLRDMTGDEGTRWEQYDAPTAVPAGSRASWGELGAGCDVDGDGFGDLGTLWPFGSVSGSANGEVFYGGATGIQATAKMPLPSGTGNNFSFTAMQPPRISCFDAYKGKAALVVSEGFDTPGALHFFAGRPLAEIGTMSSPDPGDAGFGAQIFGGTHTDVDGDGKEDLVVISNQFGWVIYGR